MARPADVRGSGGEMGRGGGEELTGLNWGGAKAYQARQPQSMERYGLRLAVHPTSDEGASRA